MLSAALLGATEGPAVSFALLTWMIVVPAVGAVVVALLPGGRTDTVRQVAMIFASLSGALSLYLLYAFERGSGEFQFVENSTWISSFGIGWHLGVDGISLFLLVLTGILFPITIMAVAPHHEAKAYYAWILVLMAGCMGVFAALDLFVFFVFFELVLVPMYFLIGKWGHGNRVYAAMKFFVYTMFGSALMLVGMLMLVFITEKETGVRTFDVVELATSQSLSTNMARLVFASFALAFAIKVPIFPVHTWLPDAHTEAPTGGSMILAGVMLKMGTYGFLRFGLYLFPEAAVWAAPFFLTVGVIGIIYGAIAATMQKDLKRLVAYSSVAHLGFIVLGTFALNPEGLGGGILQMINHGISTGALFLLVGMIYERRHTREIALLSGMQKSAPVLAAAFTLVMLSSIGLPGLNGFVGEFLILVGTFNAHRWWAIVAATGVILAALYLLWAYQRVFHGPPGPDDEEMPDMTLSEGMAILPLLALIVFLGVYPKPMIERIEPSVDSLLSHMSANVDGFVVTGPQQMVSHEVGDLVTEHGDSHGEKADGHSDDDDHGSEGGE